MNLEEERIQLGSTSLNIPPMGIGAWAWGDRLVWGYGRGYGNQEVESAIQACLDGGIDFFDTAEVYGQGKSERLLGHYLKAAGKSAVLATKFAPYPWRLSQKSLISALRGSLRRLEMESVDLYQIHFYIPPVPIETWGNALADAVELGLARAVGVSNFNPRQMRRAHAALVKRGHMLASNQIEYSLYNRSAERSGLLDLCRELNIAVIAYSPLAQGILTGKYGPDKPPPGIRGRKYSPRLLARLQPLLKLLRKIGEAHSTAQGPKSPSQVALNWTICKGTIPIPGAKNARQARENAGALGWRLTQEEVALLDQASDKVQ